MRENVKRLFFSLLIFLPLLLNGKSTIKAAPETDKSSSPYLLGSDQKFILIDAGHGGVDGGTSYGAVLEKDLTLEISRKLYLILRSNGFNAVLNRFGDYAPSEENRWFESSSRHRRDLSQRKGLADTLPASLVISIHVNWAPTSSKHGPVVLYQKNGSSFLLANSIQHQLNQLYHVNESSLHGRPYFMLNKITAPTVIVETGFISSSIDRAKLLSRRGQEDIAEAIALGIAAYLMEV